jgi:hypothetical protein
MSTTPEAIGSIPMRRTLCNASLKNAQQRRLTRTKPSAMNRTVRRV